MRTGPDGRRWATVTFVVGTTSYMLPAAVVAADSRYGLLEPVSEITLPALGIEVGPIGTFLVLLCSIALGAVLVYLSLFHEEKSHRGDGTGPSPGRMTVYPDDGSMLLTEYEQVGQEARYRDRLIIRTNYFTLVIFAAFVAVYVDVPVEARPAIAMVGSVVAFAFTTAVAKYVSARNELRDRQEELETATLAEPRLWISHTLRERDREGLSEIHMSSLIIRLHGVLTAGLVIWYAIAVYIVINGHCAIIPS